MAWPKLLFSSPRGEVMEHPTLLASVRSGDRLLHPTAGFVPLPRHARLVHLPGRLPVGIDPSSGRLRLLDQLHVGGQSFTPQAVGALLPPGYTRTLLPGEVKAGGPILPQWAYTAAGWGIRGPVAWALRTDRRRHWSPERFSTAELPRLISAHHQRFPGNRVLAQLDVCARAYRCFTSQNIFYLRDEGAIPASSSCNARCVGCISEQPAGGAPASHQRLSEPPSGREMAEVGVFHLSNARGRAMISFGQGCEGEPLTRSRAIAEAIAPIRAKTGRGSININTNASLPGALKTLLDCGLDAVRISLNSANPRLYEAYYQPRGYRWKDVEASIAVARERRAYVALNLLSFPGVSDSVREVRALAQLVQRYRIDQVQTRSLCIDPLQYLEVARCAGANEEGMGIQQMLRRLCSAAPWLRIGNFAMAIGERETTPQRSAPAFG